MAHSPNLLLATLSAETFAALDPHLETIDLKFGDVLSRALTDIDSVYFPHSGVISLVVELSLGSFVETAMIGRNGVLSASAALDGKLSFNKSIVQLAGVSSKIDVDRLREVADAHYPFRSLLVRHDQALFAQSQQSAACNASHSLEARMCRWLLHMRDFADSNDVDLTQDYLAQMLGVARPSVTNVANALQLMGLIRYRRGHIRILDESGMKKCSCECYSKVKANYDRLID